MARSGEVRVAPARRGRAAAILAVLAAAGLLAGCSTTMQEATRLQLNSARIRASQVSTKVTSATATNRQVRVTRLDVVTAGRRAAFVVDVRNDGPKPVSDLPISVGYRRADGVAVYVNAADDLNYFQAHLPVITSGRELTWVYTASAVVPSGARPFALIGSRPAAPSGPTSSLPRITARALQGGDRLRIALDNLSSVPQYQLQVYAVATRAGGYVAAGSATVEHLGTSSARTIELPLLGSLSRASVEVEALPTIFR